MLDQTAADNARILFTCKYVNEGKEMKVSANYCLEHLYLHLVTPLRKRNAKTATTIWKKLKITIAGVLRIDVKATITEERRHLAT